MSLEKALQPIVNWPEKSGENYTAIQLEISGKPYLRLGYGYHGWVLKGALEEQNIKYGQIVKDSHPDGMVGMGEHREVYSIPNSKGKSYRLVGTGFASIDVENKIAQFRGQSIDYKLGINKTHLEDIAKIETEWTIKIRKD